MPNQNGGQTIECSVGSCRFNEQKHNCSLDCISVSPVEGHSDGMPCESMCSSYKQR